MKSRVARSIGIVVLLGACSSTHHSSAPKSTTTAAPQTESARVAACSAVQLRASASLQVATDMTGGGIWFSNIGSTPCSLQGQASLRLADESGRSLPVTVTHYRGSEPLAGVVTLAPHVAHGAFVTVVWWNWCTPKEPHLIQVAVPALRRWLNVKNNGFEAPRCSNPSARSVLSVGRVQAAATP